MDWPKKKSRWYSISILLKFPWKASMMELLNLKCTQSSFRQWNKISHSFKTVADDLVGIRRHRCEWWPQSMHQVRRQVFYIFHWPPLAFWRFRVLQRVSAGFEGWQSQSDSCCDSTTVCSREPGQLLMCSIFDLNRSVFLISTSQFLPSVFPVGYGNHWFQRARYNSGLYLQSVSYKSSSLTSSTGDPRLASVLFIPANFQWIFNTSSASPFLSRT